MAPTPTASGAGRAIESAAPDEPSREDPIDTPETPVDAVLTREIGEIAFHTLRDRYVAVYAAPTGSVRRALERLASGALEPLAAPTHASEAAGAPGEPADSHPQEK